MGKRVVVIALICACGARPQRTVKPEPEVIPGAFEANRGPDGNSIVLDAPDGLIVIDTGRHRAHQDKLLAYARDAHEPIVAIINTHWHLDHTGGNAEIRAVYPKAEIVATHAIDGALRDFFPRGRKRGDEIIAKGEAPPEQIADIKLDHAAVDDPDNLRPTRPITASGPVTIGGRALELHVAPYAATAADLWIYDAATKTVFSGDLVVAAVPFFDTGCPDGWRKALDEIAAVPFVRLVPGHGAPMTHEAFLRWKTAFDALVDCAASTADVASCAAGWRSGAGDFIPHGDEAMIDEYVSYYVSDVLRSSQARARFCKP